MTCGCPDYKTDAAIQKSLRTELSKDTTVITIAHRLQTIMDSDKIVRFDEFFHANDCQIDVFLMMINDFLFSWPLTAVK